MVVVVVVQILSVDDDPINQIVIATVLESAEFVVHQAMDGFEALQYMANTTTLPDLILLDVMMPGEFFNLECNDRLVRYTVVNGSVVRKYVHFLQLSLGVSTFII